MCFLSVICWANLEFGFLVFIVSLNCETKAYLLFYPEYTFGSFNLQFMTITKRLIFKYLWYQCTSRITSNYEFAAHLCVPIVNNYLHLILSINRERAFWFSYKSLSNWPITFHLTLVAYRYILYSVNWSSIVRKQFHHNPPQIPRWAPKVKPTD